MPRQCNYDLRGNNFLERRVKSVRYGTESISSLAPKIWEILLTEIKDFDTLQIFKAKIKKASSRMPLQTMQNLSASNRIYLGNRNHRYIKLS